MKRFCTECGKPADAQDIICTECGVRLPVAAPGSEPQSAPRQPLSTKKKVLYGLIGFVAILVIGFSIWANQYYSEEAVQKRFDDALVEKDPLKLSKVTVREDAQPLSNKEAESFLRLAKQEKKTALRTLFEVVPNGKAFGIYPKHAVKVIDQYAEIAGETDGISFHIDGSEMPAWRDRHGASMLGPFSPGIYQVTAEFASEYGSASSTQELILADPDSDAVWLQTELDIGNASFEMQDWNQYAAFNPWIQIGDSRIAFQDEGTTEEIGPLVLNGSQTVKVGIQLPWGEMFSDPYPVEGYWNEVQPAILDEKQIDDVLSVLALYGDEYAKMLAEHSADKLTTVSKDYRSSLASMIDDYQQEGYYFTGSFNSAAIDRKTIFPTPEGIRVLTELHYKSDFHDLGEAPELEEGFNTCLADLQYSEGDSNWAITNCESVNHFYYDITDEKNGAGVVYAPSGKRVAAAQSKKLEEELEEFMYHFTEKSVAAINARDFSIVESYITEEGPRRKEAKDYIDYLESKGITERLLSLELEKVEDLQNGTYRVTTLDEFDIHRTDGTVTKKFRTVTLVKQVDGQFLVNELVSTKEI